MFMKSGLVDEAAMKERCGEPRVAAMSFHGAWPFGFVL
jgi:hypothetical protein